MFISCLSGFYTQPPDVVGLDGVTILLVVYGCGNRISTVYFIDQWCPFLWDVVITKMLADNGAVLAFYQRIIIGSAGAGLGEFDQ